MYCLLRMTLPLLVSLGAVAQSADAFRDLVVDGVPWVRAVAPVYDAQQREATYKPYAAFFDFSGQHLITKGLGGTFPHHRGLFIGWKKTFVGWDRVDSWHMKGCIQEHVRWLATSPEVPGLAEEIVWQDDKGKAFITEVRRLKAVPMDEGLHAVDFSSTLTAADKPVRCRGDAHHSGVQFRFAEEVTQRPETTEFVLPAKAKRHKDDRVTGAWWVCASAEVAGQRQWVLFMTAPDCPGGPPPYGIRPYGLFGPALSLNLAPGRPVTTRFRLIVSKNALDRETCDAIYQMYWAQMSSGG